MKRPVLAAFGFLTLVMIVMGVAAQDSNQKTSEDGPLPPGPHVNLVYAKCQTCHSLKKVVDSQGLPPFLWEDTIDLMLQLGLKVTAEEKAKLLTYLTTYMGPNPPPEGAAESANAPPESNEAQPAEDGEALFTSHCSSCHQVDGQGIPGAFPPLAGHAPELYTAEGGRAYLPSLLLNGLQGEIQVQGETYNGVMPAWAQLPDTELAAILNYVLIAWDNEALLPETFMPFAVEDFALGRNQDRSAAEMLERRPNR